MAFSHTKVVMYRTVHGRMIIIWSKYFFVMPYRDVGYWIYTEEKVMEQIMEWFKTWLNRDDIYHIIVPLAAVVIGWLLQYFKGNFKVEKQWKYIREKSACDKYFYYCARVFIFGMLVSIIYVVFLCMIVAIFIVYPNEIVMKVTYTIFIIIAYAVFAIYTKEEEIVFRKFKRKKQYKNEKSFKYVMNMLPNVLAGVIWIDFFCGYSLTLIKIVTILTVFFEFVAMVIIDDTRIFQFRYATFYFYGDEDNNVVEYIETCKIFQKGAWIIAKNEKDDVEHRFRIKDIKRIEYFNS